MSDIRSRIAALLAGLMAGAAWPAPGIAASSIGMAVYATIGIFIISGEIAGQALKSLKVLK